jgi:hypothetical protein
LIKTTKSTERQTVTYFQAIHHLFEIRCSLKVCSLPQKARCQHKIENRKNDLGHGTLHVALAERENKANGGGLSKTTRAPKKVN